MNWKIQGFGALAALLLFAPSVPAAESIASLQQARAEEICGTVKAAIAEGMDAKVVVRTAITLGHAACPVVRCAIDGGGELEPVMAGAVGAGAPSEVVSRCAIDAGAAAADVAAILSLPGMLLNICYFQPEGYARLQGDELTAPVIDPLVSMDRGAEVLSAYDFR